MPVIRIAETGRDGDGFLANLTFDTVDTYPIQVKTPFTVEQEKDLEWYFEEHLRFPFADKVRARDAGKSVYTYGMALFEQIFADRYAFVMWSKFRADLPSVRIEIVGSPEFQSLHWEALVEPQTRIPISTLAIIVRKHTAPQLTTTRLPESPTVNILLIVARPSGAHDVSYRTISRPLVTALDNARVHARIDIVRPGTFEALLRHLEENRLKPEADRYHIVHFDLHGGLMTYEDLKRGLGGGQIHYQSGYGLNDIEPYVGKRAFLLFAGEETDNPTYVEADQLGHRLIEYGVPIAVLNACQSGKQVGAQETSLASRLMAAGLQLVVAMTYSVTVTASECAMTKFYGFLLEGKPVATAIVGARRELERNKSRQAYYGQKVDLEDWMLPIIYESREIQLTPKRMFPEEEELFFQKEAAHYEGVSPEFGFFGRDLDILNIENNLLRRAEDNILLVRGMGGAGKTTLLKHLAAWWQRTALVDEVLYFGYDEKAHTRQQILRGIAEKLLDKYRFTTFESSSSEAQKAMIASELRKTRHLLILDNLESITGERLAIPNTLSESEQNEFHSFLLAVRGGQSLVLLGSRSDEKWLTTSTFEKNVYDLGGLDPEAASNLAERILETRGATKYKADTNLSRLIRLLAGFPLALEVVLSNLPAKSPTAILEELESGGLDLNTGDANDKTKSIVACIDYSHSNLSEEAQSLLLCLAPFTNVFNAGYVGQYSAVLKTQSVLAQLPFEQWSNVLAEAQRMGLMLPHKPGSQILRLQPVFPYFLRARLSAPVEKARQHAIETAFRRHYRGLAGGLIELMRAKDPNHRKLGLFVTGLEDENLRKAGLDSASLGEDFFLPLRALSHRFDDTQDHEAGLAIALAIRERLAEREREGRVIPAGSLSAVLDQLGSRFWKLKRHSEAKKAYLENLEVQTQQANASQLSRDRAATLYQLGILSVEERQWAEAESYYTKALAIDVEFNDGPSQALTLHQLGNVYFEQRLWPEAESYYNRAIEINVTTNDRYGSAKTLHQLGYVYQMQDHWPEAEILYKQSLAIFMEFGDRYNQARTLHQLGMVSEEHGQASEAESRYKQSLSLKIGLNDRYSQASTLHQLGNVCFVNSRLPEAENYYNQALAINIEFSDRHGQAKILHQLGTVDMEQRHWSKAEDHYGQSLAIFMEFGDHYSASGTVHQLGIVAEKQSHWPEAVSNFIQVLVTCVELKYHLEQDLAMRGLARVWRASGDRHVVVETASVLGIEPDEVQVIFTELPED